MTAHPKRSNQAISMYNIINTIGLRRKTYQGITWSKDGLKAYRRGIEQKAEHTPKL